LAGWPRLSMWGLLVAILGLASLADHHVDRHGSESLEKARVGWLLSRPSAAETSRRK